LNICTKALAQKIRLYGIEIPVADELPAGPGDGEKVPPETGRNLAFTEGSTAQSLMEEGDASAESLPLRLECQGNAR
jgi:hypothetical protein